MGRHSRPPSTRKVAPSLVLAFSVLSVGSPLALLLFSPRVEAEPTSSTIQEIPISLPLLPRPPALDAAAVLAQAREQIEIPTSLPTSTPRPPKRSDITTRPPTSRPTPAVSTRPHPTVAERQIQRASTSPTTTQKKVSLAAPTQKAEIPKRTTTVPATTTTTTPKPTVVKKTTQIPSTAPKAIGIEKIIPIAKKYVGTGIPYVMGGNSLSSGMDCSHFVWMVLKEAGYRVPYRDSYSLASWTTRIKDPRPGDLVLYVGHVGIYAGNGMMIHHGKDGGAFFAPINKTENFIGYGRMSL